MLAKVVSLTHILHYEGVAHSHLTTQTSPGSYILFLKIILNWKNI